MGCTQSGAKGGVAKPTAKDEKIDIEITDPGADATPFQKKYFLTKTVLGKGNYSVVKEGLNRSSNEVVAVKCITKANLTREDEDALQIETQILKEMDHPNIIKMYDFYEEEKMYYIVTEMMTGGELFDRIVEKEFYSERDAQRVVATLASALKYCHGKGVVHRDLKPENILLTTKDETASIKIADFGFAKKLNDPNDPNSAPAEGLTTACGTPGYVAPEIINGKPYSKEVDMWSLGVIVYILLCGYPPFHDDNQAMLFKLIRKGQYEFDEPYWNNISTEAKDLISGLLTVDHTKRLTVEQLIGHAWLANEASNKDITPALDKLRSFQARARWKKGIGAVTAANQLKNLGLAAAAARGATQDPPKIVD